MKPRQTLACAVVYLGLLSCLHAWWPMEHLRSGTDADAATINLPDAFDGDLFGIHWIPPAGILAPSFAWGHRCQNAGQADAGPVPPSWWSWLVPFAVPATVPRKPSYEGDAITDPGADMKPLLLTKLDQSRFVPADLALMKSTARGFVGHNKADRGVHFEYFGGGSLSGWVIDHRRKEEWSEYVVIANANAGTFPGDLPDTVPCSGHAGLINLAQKVFRKNGQSVDAMTVPLGQRRPGPVLSSAAITAAMDAASVAMTEKVGGYSMSTWIVLQAEAADPARQWDATDLLSKYNAAKAAAQAEMNALFPLPP